LSEGAQHDARIVVVVVVVVFVIIAAVVGIVLADAADCHRHLAAVTTTTTATAVAATATTRGAAAAQGSGGEIEPAATPPLLQLPAELIQRVGVGLDLVHRGDARGVHLCACQTLGHAVLVAPAGQVSDAQKA
jgi:hypothetical protein